MIPGYVPSLIERLRAQAISLFREGVRAADPASAVTAALSTRQNAIERARRVIVLAFGKAAVSMAEAAIPFVHRKLGAAIALTAAGSVRPVPGFVVIGGGHPVPDRAALGTAAAIERAATAARAGDLVLALVSGGGSSLLCAPPRGIDLRDKISLNDALVRSGANIVEMNTVRSMVSRLKGGGLARQARPASLLALILSDVPGDDPAVIASGPTAPSRGSGEEALSILKKYGLLEVVPHSISSHLRNKFEPGPDDCFDHVENVVIGSNGLSVRAAMLKARQSYDAVLLGREWLCGDVSTAANELHAMALAAAAGNRPVAIVCGGETSVRVTGGGTGGRNQELALRFALLNEVRPIPRPWVFLSGGTDGRDGPTDAAGGIVDEGSASWMRQQGCDPLAQLSENNSFAALACSGDLLITGPTGTNVADLQIMLLQ